MVKLILTRIFIYLTTHPKVGYEISQLKKYNLD